MHQLNEVSKDLTKIKAADNQWVTKVCIATALHELAHQWYDYNIYNFGITNDDLAHASYVKGKGGTYCLFRSNSANGENFRTFLTNQAFQMRFSDGIEYRLANTFYFNRYK